MTEAFPQKIEKEEFKQYMQSAYKAGVVDSIEEATTALLDFINSKDNVFEKNYVLGFTAAIDLLTLFKTEAIIELEGKTSAELITESENKTRSENANTNDEKKEE